MNEMKYFAITIADGGYGPCSTIFIGHKSDHSKEQINQFALEFGGNGDPFEQCSNFCEWLIANKGFTEIEYSEFVNPGNLGG